MASKNKLFKGAIAGVTGVALLAGGFGSFALFTDQETLPSGALNTGVLDITAGAAAYADRSTDAANTTWDPAVDEMVPGDVIEVAMPLTVTAEGKNLKGKVDFDKTAINLAAPELGGMLTVDYDLVLVNDATTGLAEAGVTYTAANAHVAFVEGDGAFEVNGVATFTLAEAANQAQADAAQTALADTAFTVNQDARS